MSVPPEIDDKCTFFLICLYTYLKLSSERGDPVEQIVLSLLSLNLYFNFGLNFLKASTYFALIPNKVIFSLCAIFKSKSGDLNIGNPSNKTIDSFKDITVSETYTVTKFQSGTSLLLTQAYINVNTVSFQIKVNLGSIDYNYRLLNGTIHLEAQLGQAATTWFKIGMSVYINYNNLIDIYLPLKLDMVLFTPIVTKLLIISTANNFFSSIRGISSSIKQLKT